MVSKAVLRYIRITPRKFRLIIPLINGRPAEVAMTILASVNKKAAFYATELLKSAIANAKRNVEGIDTSRLYISGLRADCGPTMKRYRAGSMGRASMIRKRTSHITLELDQTKELPDKAVEIKEKDKKVREAKTKAVDKTTSPAPEKKEKKVKGKT